MLAKCTFLFFFALQIVNLVCLFLCNDSLVYMKPPRELTISVLFSSRFQDEGVAIMYI